jgi:hypothetical protein
VLEGLDEIDWAQLEHAYGSARDVPQLIRALAGGDDKAIRSALDELNCTIYHQGTVYTASAPAVRFLAQMLDVLPPPHQAALLDLLGHLAQGHGYYDVHRALPWAKKFLEARQVKDPAATLAAEHTVVHSTTLAVFGDWSRIEACLDSPDWKVRIAALFVLSLLGQSDASEPAPPDMPVRYLDVRPAGTPRGSWAARVRQLADERLIEALAPAESAAWRRALLQMEAHDHPALQLEAAGHLAPLSRYVIVRSIILRCRQAGSAVELPGELAPILADLADHHVEIRETAAAVEWPWNDWFDVGILQLFNRVPDAALDEVAPACARLIADAPGLAFRYELLLQLVLGTARPQIPANRCTLSRGRRQIAQVLLEEPAGKHNRWSFWARDNGNASNACRQFGVPHDRKLWMKWLETAA